MTDESTTNNGSSSVAAEIDGGKTPGPGSAPPSAPPPRKVREIATTAVMKLGIQKFIDDHLKEITVRLEECEGAARTAPVDSKMLFIALSLPILNGVIHIASNQKSLQEAIDWATRKWREDENRVDFDPVTILSALTLIYAVIKCWEQKKKDPVWTNIIGHIAELAKELAE